MSVEQDYLMRMIKQMIRALIGILNGKENPLNEMPLEEQYKSVEGYFRELLEMVNDGQINEAENLLYEKIDYTNKKEVGDAILFYGYLNELDDDFLEENNYTRDEISLGLKQITRMIGMESIMDALEP